jgi:hypothetical protein
MHSFTQRASQQTTSAKSTLLGRANRGPSRAMDVLLHLQRTVGNQATQRLLREKSVDGESGNRVGLVVEQAPDGGAGPKDAGAPAPAKQKKAGVDSFTVTWKKNPSAGPTKASLRLDYSAKFKKDDAHDPALAEFRQNVLTKLEVTDGPNKGTKIDTSPLHDDNYSRADDTAGNAITDTKFVSEDNPEAAPLDKDDVIDYSFTAEQLIIDTSDGNKVIARRGAHTATIKGKHPRTFAGVPKTL